jgi:hypothetical protein
MAKRRRTAQHLWNRFMAAVLFVLGVALSTAPPTETQETRVSRAASTQLDIASYAGRHLSTPLTTRLDGDGDDGFDDQPVLAPSVFTFAYRDAGLTQPIAAEPPRPAKRLARDGDSRAPPSA